MTTVIGLQGLLGYCNMSAPQRLMTEMQRKNSATPSGKTGNQTPSPDLPGATPMMQQYFSAMKVLRN
jgi:hypothetical protein